MHWVSVAVRESVINAIKHGNHGRSRASTSRSNSCSAPAREPREFVVEVLDEGVGFDPEAVANPLDAENVLKSSGRGIFFMQSFMDDVRMATAARRRHVCAHDQEARLIVRHVLDPLYLATAIEAALAAGRDAPAALPAEPRIHKKGPIDLVTAADLAAERDSARSSPSGFRTTRCWAKSSAAGPIVPRAGPLPLDHRPARRHHQLRAWPGDVLRLDRARGRRTRRSRRRLRPDRRRAVHRRARPRRAAEWPAASRSRRARRWIDACCARDFRTPCATAARVRSSVFRVPRAGARGAAPRVGRARSRATSPPAGSTGSGKSSCTRGTWPPAR